MSWKDATDIVSNLAVSAAAVVGGWWALTRYLRERTDEAALEIDLATKSYAFAGKYLVDFDVMLTNKGRTKLQAKVSAAGQPAFSDPGERLAYSCGLQVRSLQEPSAGAAARLDWFDNPLLQQPLGVAPEINLLAEYEDPNRNNAVDFWMEPNESYHLCSPVLLPAGLYLAKVTFIGAAGDDNFWSRVCVVPIPTPKAD